ncbi:GrpB family protein [uncultured Photobacterium sp.]|uniref:GrpB family protein n=1 Tax=uncultured Photobacterium sp. TaxID=173973 RepID=UPI00345D6EB3
MAITLHHIGSTLVPGLSAKPTIDILAEVDDLFYFDQVSQKLELLEYEGKGEFGISGRRYFKKGSERHSYHLHVFASGDSNIHRHICFRNYLVAHPEVAKEYGELKKKIAARCDHDTVVYCDEKNDFVQHHQSLAI